MAERFFLNDKSVKFFQSNAPSQVFDIMITLRNHGYEAYLVGGSVRNIVHNQIHSDTLPVKDWDITTNASYEEVKRIFSSCGYLVDERGASFLVCAVRKDNVEIEISTYRTEWYPEGGNVRPKGVNQTHSLEEDLKRRDFKMNQLVIDHNGIVIDHFGGIKDIETKKISTVGDPKERFNEDPFRMVRAIRFMSQLGYDLSFETKKEIIHHNLEHPYFPVSRTRAEMEKILKGKFVEQALYEASVIAYQFKSSANDNNFHFNFFLITHWIKITFENYPLTSDFLINCYMLYGKNNISFLYEHQFFSKQEIRKLDILQKVWDYCYWENEIEALEDFAEELNMSRINRKELEDALNWMEPLIFFGKFQPFISGNFVEKIRETKLFTSELPINGKWFVEKGFKGKEVGKVISHMVKMMVRYGDSFNLEIALSDYIMKKNI